MSQQELNRIIDHVNRVNGISLDAGDYAGYYLKKMTTSSSIAVARAGHGYHIEITDPDGPMLLFPVVTSSAYIDSRTTDEKRRYFAKLSVRVLTDNLLRLVTRVIETSPANLDNDIAEYRTMQESLRNVDSPAFTGMASATLQIRGTDQVQLEIGKSDDSDEFKRLRLCLLPEDYLLFLQRGPAEYDVVGLTREELASAKPMFSPFFYIGKRENPVPPSAVGELSFDTLQQPDLKAISSLKLKKLIRKGKLTPEVLRYFDEKTIREAISAILSGRHVILYGPPGTGKTFLATQLALIFGSTVDRVTATQNWSTFDTIGGFKYQSRDSNQSPEFMPVDGCIVRAIRHCFAGLMPESWKGPNAVSGPWNDYQLLAVLRFFNEKGVRSEKDNELVALANRINRLPGSVALRLLNYLNCQDPTKGLSGGGQRCRQLYLEYSGSATLLGERLSELESGGEFYIPNWLIIDEFNRCEIDAALGEMFTCLEPISGEEDEELWDQFHTLHLDHYPENDERRILPIPRTFRIVGTMNTYDKHFLNTLSYALMRRFSFVYVSPVADADVEWELITEKVRGFARGAPLALDLDLILAKLQPIFKKHRALLRGFDGSGKSTDPSMFIRDIAAAQWIDVVKGTVFLLDDFEGRLENLIDAYDRSFAGNIVPQLEGLLGQKLQLLRNGMTEFPITCSAIDRLLESERLI